MESSWHRSGVDEMLDRKDTSVSFLYHHLHLHLHPHVHTPQMLPLHASLAWQSLLSTGTLGHTAWESA